MQTLQTQTSLHIILCRLVRECKVGFLKLMQLDLFFLNECIFPEETAHLQACMGLYDLHISQDEFPVK